ncbi:MAG: glutaredoxin 3 [Gammaproteobacteria bacterium]|nr:glutaredoxin 3 [Gammaproteobacteria bacterium]
MNKIEIYSKDWCPYCAKAKSLLQSKQLEYAEIDITTDQAREQEMIKRSSRRTVPQIFIDGEAIGGYDDLADLNAKGELDQRLGLTSDIDLSRIYDVIVIGAGPSGLSAAIYAQRKNLSTLIISSDIGGQLGTTYEVANYPGIQMITGPDLVAQFNAHVDEYQIEKLIGEKVVDLRLEGRCKIVRTASGREIRGRSLIVATGAQKRKLDIPGEKALAGRGVVYCSTCDGPLFRNMNIAIVGGGNSGLEAAIEMAGVASQVYLVSAGDLTGDAVLQDKVIANPRIEVLTHHQAVTIHGEDRVSALTVEDLSSGESRQLEVEGVFIEIGLSPNSAFALDLLDTNHRGELEVGAKGHTGSNGIFAAGDVTDDQSKQIVIAAGSGASAALGAFEYLVSQV